MIAVRMAIAAVALLLGGCRAVAGSPRDDADLSRAWAAWQAGDFAGARVEAESLLTEPETAAAGHLMLALTAHVQGDHRAAITHFERIDRNCPWYGLLVEPLLWSYVFAGEFDGAVAHAERHRLGRVTRDRIRLARDRPLAVAIGGVVELPFTTDALSAYMPGVEGTLNGVDIIARLDTGGAYVHLSEDAAQRFGIATIGCDTGFASLSRTRICYGVADLELGPVTLRNVPVAVHAEGLSAAPLAEHFGSRMDAIIGTNVLERFLATVDGPNARLILSDRQDPTAAERHRLLLDGAALEVPFGMWTDHLMIARGELAGRSPVNVFVDSGLVIVTPDQGQASLLIPQRTLEALGGTVVDDQPLSPLPGASGLAGAVRQDLLAYPVPERTWQGFGDWGGVEVAALIGWGYLKHYAWTVDFDRRVFLLRAGERTP